MLKLQAVIAYCSNRRIV